MRGNFLVFWLQNGRQPQLTQIRSDHWLQKRFRSWHRSINTNSAAAVTPPSKDGGRMAGGDWTSKIQHPTSNIPSPTSKHADLGLSVARKMCYLLKPCFKDPIIVFVTQLVICYRFLFSPSGFTPHASSSSLLHNLRYATDSGSFPWAILSDWESQTLIGSAVCWNLRYATNSTSFPRKILGN